MMILLGEGLRQGDSWVPAKSWFFIIVRVTQ